MSQEQMCVSWVCELEDVLKKGKKFAMVYTCIYFIDWFVGFGLICCDGTLHHFLIMNYN